MHQNRIASDLVRGDLGYWFFAGVFRYPGKTDFQGIMYVFVWGVSHFFLGKVSAHVADHFGNVPGKCF